MKVTIEFKINREGLSDLDGQTDQLVILGWIESLLGSTNQGDILSHLTTDGILKAIRAGDEEKCSLTPFQFWYVQMSICRATVPGKNNRLYSQIARKFGMELPPHDPTGSF